MDKLIAIFLILAAGSAQSADRLATVQVSGLSVPGTRAMVKEQGFTECVDLYNYLSCTRSKPVEVFGATASSAQIPLDVSDNFASKADPMGGAKIADVSPDKLTYRTIRLEFQPKEREALEKALLADGWFAVGNEKNVEFYKAGVAATFRVNSGYTTLSPVAVGEVNKLAARQRATAAHHLVTSNYSDQTPAMSPGSESLGVGPIRSPRF